MAETAAFSRIFAVRWYLREVDLLGHSDERALLLVRAFVK
jgi:hypothetical protein